ncbi:MAG: transglycosylase SLT domain-containing protein [Acidobacteria bacterium]|nr:transglycosylase SLT domain-containing protein [Acidobacteriota bacterium]
MPQAKALIYLFLLTFLSARALSQTSETQSSETAQLSIVEVESIGRRDPKEFSVNNYDYLLARLYEKQGDFAKAAANFQAVAARDSVLKEYALWHLSQLMRNSGNLIMERIYLTELSLNSETSLLHGAVKKRLALSNYESENFSETARLLTEPTISPDSNSDQQPEISREDLVLLGNSYLNSKQPEKAREIFTTLADDSPKPEQPDDFALGGVVGLDRIDVGDENFGSRVSDLSAEEHVKRADIYQFNRNFDLARLHYKAVVGNYPDSDQAVNSMYQIGRGYDQERLYKSAVEWFERIQKEFPTAKLSASALYQTASGYANLDQTQKAVSAYEKYISENPSAGNLERAYLNIIDAYRDAGDDKQALAWAAKAQTQFIGKTGEALARFSQLRIHLSQEKWQDSLNDLNALDQMNERGGANTAGSPNTSEILFLRGFVLEKLGRFDEAIDAYLSTPTGKGEYYGSRATDRLQTLAALEKTAGIVKQRFNRLSAIADQTVTSSNAGEVRLAAQNAMRISPDDETSSKLLERVKTANSLLDDYKAVPVRTFKYLTRDKPLTTKPKFGPDDRHRIIADMLLFLRIYDEGTPELETAMRKDLENSTGSLNDFPPDTAFTLAVLYDRGDVANRSTGYIESLWRKIPNDYPIELIPRQQLEMLFPAPYKASLIKYGRENNVDPRFILSIMRQESRFRSDVKSVAAARGLMQFISNTSNKMAEEMAIANFVQDDLYDPPTAIRFGSFYLSKIFKDFPDKHAAVAASYNGGEDRMMRWFKRSRTDDPDRYVSEIFFAQTKDYVYKVMSNYRIYKRLYDENLKTR